VPVLISKSGADPLYVYDVFIQLWQTAVQEEFMLINKMGFHHSS
jgi:hypothetical protein